MSKTAEKKALEAYPISVSKTSVEAGFDWNEEYRDVFMEGYEQAMEDFMEKACEWLNEYENGTTIIDIDSFIKGFKKYMEE